jgi:hypothetical protein
MSLNGSEREGGSAGLGLAQPLVPRLAPAAAGGYAAWRPLMENVLMRAGVALRDYTQENADWAALVAAVDRWTTEDESASIAYALGRATAGSASSAAGPTAAEKEARRGATEAVARAKRAYALLYQALPDELRRLVAHVPQGHAYGLWSWLERRFQSTEQDNVGDLWDQFTALSQTDEESFDEYKARVDHVYGLLAHAKDKPSAGQYAHRLLWKLAPVYHPAVLARKASGKLKEAEKIDWSEIVAFVNTHERSQTRLDGDGAAGGRLLAMAATAQGQRRGVAEKRECFNCGEVGHISRNCKQPRRARQAEHEQDDDEEVVGDDAGHSGRRSMRGASGRRGGASNGAARASMLLAGRLSSEDEEGGDEQAISEWPARTRL